MLADTDDNKVELKDAKYYKDILSDRNIGIYISWNGRVITVPINEKNSDFLVINNINDISFGSDTNKVTIINKKAKVFESEEKNKHIIAQEIIKNTLI